MLVTFTETEIAWIIHVLSKKALLDEDIRKVIRVIVAHLPMNYELSEIPHKPALEKNKA